LFDVYRTTVRDTMTDHRITTDADPTRRLQQKRRVKRGIVAGYIHELSERHNDSREEAPVEELAEQVQGD
jgi:hypothetical protein